MLRLASALCSILLITACSMNPTTPAAAVSQLTPTGKLRVAINYGNAVLAKRDAATGEVSGVSVDLARELAQRLGVELQLLPFDAANKSVEAIKNKQADVGFFAIDPLRGADTDYTAAYVVIEGTYVVPQASPIKVNADVDKPGTRIAVAAKSAYDLFLSREIKQATPWARRRLVLATRGAHAAIVERLLNELPERVLGRACTHDYLLATGAQTGARTQARARTRHTPASPLETLAPAASRAGRRRCRRTT